MSDDAAKHELEAEKKRLLPLYVACGLTTVLVFASFHPLDLGFLAWIALVPWLFFALRESRLAAIVMSYGTTFLYHLLGLSWIGLVTGPGWVATTFLEGFYSVGVVLAVRWMRRRTSLPVSVLLPPLWVMGEHHRGAHLLFIKFPWLLLGQTQHARSWLTQIADVTSVYGLSFLVVLVNAFLVDVLLYLDAKNQAKKDLDDHDRRHLAKLAIYPAAALLVATIYGAIRSSQVQSSVIDGPRLLAVQCDVPQSVKESMDPEHDPMRELAEENFALTRTSLAAIQNNAQLPDAILWSETVWLYPFNSEYPDWRHFDELWTDWWNMKLPPVNGRPAGDVLRAESMQLFQIPEQYHADLILGVYDRPSFETIYERQRGKDVELTYRNRVYQIAPEGTPRVREHYDKINLVPASEGIPYRGTWFYNLIKKFVPPNFQTLEPGDGIHVMALTKPPHWKLSCDICFEISFPELIREGTSNGADILFCPSNDGWFHTPDDIASAEIPLALDHACFRAIENRRGVVRIVNRGITCFIDPLGRVVDAVEGKKRLRDGTLVASQVHVEGAILNTVPTTRLMSFYVRFGDVFAWLCWVASAGLIGFSFMRKGTAAAQPT